MPHELVEAVADNRFHLFSTIKYYGAIKTHSSYDGPKGLCSIPRIIDDGTSKDVSTFLFYRKSAIYWLYIQTQTYKAVVLFTNAIIY